MTTTRGETKMMTKRYFWSPKPSRRGWYVKSIDLDLDGQDSGEPKTVETVQTKAEAIRRAAELNLIQEDMDENQEF
jgi:hypothetical protein